MVISAFRSDTTKEREDPMQGEKENDKSHKWNMLCHLISFTGIWFPLGNIAGPLIIWLLKRNEYHTVDTHGKESINFQISMTAYAVISFFLCQLLIGFVLLPAVLLTNIVLVIMASVKANDGQAYRYPFTIRLIK